MMIMIMIMRPILKRMPLEARKATNHIDAIVAA